MVEETPERRKSNAIAITLIVVGGLIILTCILSVLAISITFLMNAPW